MIERTNVEYKTIQFNPESEAVYLKHTVWMVAEWEMKNAELKNLALDVEDEGEVAVSIYNRFGEIPLCFWFLIFWIITILRKNSNMLMICTIKIKFIQSKPFYPHSKWSSFSFIWITIFRCWSRADSWSLRVNFYYLVSFYICVTFVNPGDFSFLRVKM